MKHLDVEGFWAKVDKTEDCWNWIGHRSPDGYGTVWWDHATRRTHRVTYEMEHGPIPEGMNVCHHCDNPLCVRPAHLFLGTQKDNVQDCIKKGRYVHNGAAKLTPADVEAIRSLPTRKRGESGSRVTIESQRDIARRYNITPIQVSRIKNNRSWRVR